MSLKLGKLAPKWHPKTLQLGKYLSGPLPDPDAKVYREYKTPDEAKQMFGNDQWGDCTCAGFANLEILWTCHTGSVVIPTLDQVLAVYSAVSGFDPATGNNDNGAAMTDVLEYMRTTGMGGRKILGWAAIDWHNLVHQEFTIQLFGATYTGVNLPQSAEDQFNAGGPWEVTDSPIAGGHAIIGPGYGALGRDFVTWAKWDQKASNAWCSQYIEEEYAVISDDWFDLAGSTPGGLNRDQLWADIKLL